MCWVGSRCWGGLRVHRPLAAPRFRRHFTVEDSIAFFNHQEHAVFGSAATIEPTSAAVGCKGDGHHFRATGTQPMLFGTRKELKADYPVREPLALATGCVGRRDTLNDRLNDSLLVM
jgi:hypothetical protein